MNENWNSLYNLETQIKEHNTHIEKITPSRTRRHSIQSSFDEIPQKPDSQQKMLAMAKDIKEKEREISYLKRDIASLEIYKDQCLNMQAQIRYLREKSVLSEREAQQKSLLLSSFETKTLPKLEKFENELKESSQTTEKLQKLYAQAKKDADDKTVLITSLKQNYSGQDSSIKALEEDKRSLKLKISDIQSKFEEINVKYEKTIEHLKNKEQLTLALEEDNERLRAQIENTMESLQKCQYELGLLPKLRQDIHQREQLITTATREIEKEKTLRIKAHEEKEAVETQLANIFDYAEGNDPIEYIQELKNLINKSTKDYSLLNEELSQLKEKQKNNDLDASNTLQSLISFLENISKTLLDDFFSDEVVIYRIENSSAAPVLKYFCEQLQKCQLKAYDKISELQKTENFLMEKLEIYEKNPLFREQIEETEKEMEERDYGTVLKKFPKYNPY